MNETLIDRRKKLPRVRRFPTIASLRREMVRVYEEARVAGADPAKIQYYRALCFILSAATSIMKDEKLESIEQRLSILESKGDN